jgi:hypothetical protein
MKHLIYIFTAIIIISSCKKKDNGSVCTDGYIYWGGPPAADGLGWYFSEGRTGTWKPKQLKETELPAEFQLFNDSTAVNICLQTTTDRAPCFCAEPSYYYKINSIKKR